MLRLAKLITTVPMTNGHSNNWSVDGRAIIIHLLVGEPRFVVSASGAAHILKQASGIYLTRVNRTEM